MSMNLIFKNPRGEYLEFPVQTPTRLTKAVLNTQDDTKKIELIIEFLKDCDWEEEDLIEAITEIKDRIKSGCELVMI